MKTGPYFGWYIKQSRRISARGPDFEEFQSSQFGARLKSYMYHTGGSPLCQIARKALSCSGHKLNGRCSPAIIRGVLKSDSPRAILCLRDKLQAKLGNFHRCNEKLDTSDVLYARLLQYTSPGLVGELKADSQLAGHSIEGSTEIPCEWQWSFFISRKVIQ